MRLDFDFNHDGTWDVWGIEGHYVVEVCEDGEFLVTYTHDDTVAETKSGPYLTLRDAQSWCNNHERVIVDHRGRLCAVNQ